jgi:hypothetical protein
MRYLRGAFVWAAEKIQQDGIQPKRDKQIAASQ